MDFLRRDDTVPFLAAVSCGYLAVAEISDEEYCVSEIGYWGSGAERGLDSISSTFNAMSRIVLILTMLTFIFLGLLINVVICTSIGSEQTFRNCMSEETVMVLLFWPVFLVGMIMLQPIPYVLINVVLVLVVWMLLRSRKKVKPKPA